MINVPSSWLPHVHILRHNIDKPVFEPIIIRFFKSDKKFFQTFKSVDIDNFLNYIEFVLKDFNCIIFSPVKCNINHFDI